MRAKASWPAMPAWAAAALVLLAGGGWRAQAADLKFETHLLWGTDDPKPPAGKSYGPVDEDIRKRLAELPLRWTNWFAVNRKPFSVTPGGMTKSPISEKCELDVKSLGGSDVEVVLFGKGKETARQKQSLGVGEILVLGGNAPNSTAWLVVLKRLQ